MTQEKTKDKLIYRINELKTECRILRAKIAILEIRNNPKEMKKVRRMLKQ